MGEREAKDFFVQQAAEQAAIEGVPLSDLEKRMMYFTESGYVPEDPIQLNEEFETQYETAEYEQKLSALLHHAYRRLKKENPQRAEQWKEAVRELNKGDHYLSVFLWGNFPARVRAASGERPPYDGLKLLGTAVLVVCAMLGLVVASAEIKKQFPNFPM